MSCSPNGPHRSGRWRYGVQESCRQEQLGPDRSALASVQFASRELLRTVCETEISFRAKSTPLEPTRSVNAELAARLSDQPSSTRHRPINIGCQSQIGWSGYRRAGSIKG